MDILQYAIKMEKDSAKFYHEQALKNKDNKLYPVFISFAKDEEKHEKIIREKKEGINSILNDNDVDSVKNVFSDITGFDFEKTSPEQLDAYRKALKMEQESIDLYKKLSSESSDDKELFEFLIKQEEEHYSLVEKIIELVNRPNGWVESAEFGLRREDY
jgi:rubrerythrin